MEIKNFFDSSEYRNSLLEILSYLSYDEISNLLCLHKKSRTYMKEFLFSDENHNILGRIINRRFFDRKECNFYSNETFLQPKFTIPIDKAFWKRHYPKIQDGDIIYLNKCDKFIHINSHQLFIRYHWSYSQDHSSIFPIEYWKEIGKKYPFRLWFNVKVFYESLKVWMTDYNKRFIDLDLDPKCYQDDLPIEICFTYVDELIYIYKGRN